LSLHREVNRLFDDVFRGTGRQTAGGEQGQGGADRFVTAPMNVSETDKDGLQHHHALAYERSNPAPLRRILAALCLAAIFQLSAHRRTFLIRL
jgi:hypothetical protein